jgi:hypothetical protein
MQLTGRRELPGIESKSITLIVAGIDDDQLAARNIEEGNIAAESERGTRRRENLDAGSNSESIDAGLKLNVDQRTAQKIVDAALAGDEVRLS